MHTQSLAKELLHSLPIDVVFVGFKGTTLGLAKNGWDLSMQQQHSIYNAGYEMRLALRHEGAKLYAISNTVHLDYGQFHGALENSVRYGELISSIIFNIQYVGNDCRFYMMPTATYGSANSFLKSWEPIDPTPQQREEVSIQDFKFFKVANQSIKDIIVSPDQVPELLDLVLKAQKPTQQQIKAREQGRANYAAYQGEVKPKHQVQAQIITLGA